MTLDTYLEMIVNSGPEDWIVMPRPTMKHSFTFQEGQEGNSDRYDLGEAPVMLGFKKNVSITLAAGTIEKAKYVIPVQTEFTNHNARTVLVDCFFDNIIVHRETMVMVDRQHCILPLPQPWTEEKQPVPKGKIVFAHLIHELIGPFTDFADYLERAGLYGADLPWPAPTKQRRPGEDTGPDPKSDAEEPSD